MREILDVSVRDNSYSVRASSDGQRVRIEVAGTTLSMIPGVAGLQVRQSASGAVEQWTVPGR